MNKIADALARIRALNDDFRQSFAGGQVVITERVRALGAEFESKCIEAVQQHSDFADDSIYAEHDEGWCLVNGTRVFWKIDYTDAESGGFCENPADAEKTARTLTIMHGHEF